MDSILHTPRLTLRPLTIEDAGPTARIMSPVIARWTAIWKGSETEVEVAERLARTLEAERAGRRFMRAATLTETGELIGWVGVVRLEAAPERGSIGYWIGETWFGQGYASEAARAVLDAAWDALDLQVIEGAAQLANLASVRILRGLGMTHMGQREEFAPARGVSDVCEWYELRRPRAAGPRSDT
jgi:RimJ/RimL family protein N-acetyltransferase